MRLPEPEPQRIIVSRGEHQILEVLARQRYIRFWSHDYPDQLRKDGFNEKTTQIMVRLGALSQGNRFGLKVPGQ